MTVDVVIVAMIQEVAAARARTQGALGHSTFLLQSPGGKRILLDPWLMENPACPAQFK